MVVTSLCFASAWVRTEFQFVLSIRLVKFVVIWCLCAGNIMPEH